MLYPNMGIGCSEYNLHEHTNGDRTNTATAAISMLHVHMRARVDFRVVLRIKVKTHRSAEAAQPMFKLVRRCTEFDHFGKIPALDLLSGQGVWTLCEVHPQPSV